MPTWAENTYSALWTRQFAFEKRIMLVHNDATGDGTIGVFDRFATRPELVDLLPTASGGQRIIDRSDSASLWAR